MEYEAISPKKNAIKTGSPTSERKPGGKAFGIIRKVLSYSKHTLLLPLFGSNRKAFGLPEGHLADFS